MTIEAVRRVSRWLVLAGLLVVACGGPTPTPPPASATSGSACDLVANMDGLVGRTAVAPPSSYTVGSSERCLWVYLADPSRYVAVTLGERGSHAATIQSFGDGETLDGLGDEARWWEANRTLSAVVGERSIQVDLQLDDAEDPKALATSIAEAALQELP